MAEGEGEEKTNSEKVRGEGRIRERMAYIPEIEYNSNFSN